MSSLLTLDLLSLSAPDGRPLFTDLTQSFGRQRTGLVGRNGSGKSTLLRAIIGEVAPMAGSITRSGSVELLRQDWTDPSIDLAEALEVAEPLAQLRRIEASKGDEADFATADWTLEARVADRIARSACDAARSD